MLIGQIGNHAKVNHCLFITKVGWGKSKDRKVYTPFFKS